MNKRKLWIGISLLACGLLPGLFGQGSCSSNPAPGNGPVDLSYSAPLIDVNTVDRRTPLGTCEGTVDLENLKLTADPTTSQAYAFNYSDPDKGDWFFVDCFIPVPNSNSYLMISSYMESTTAVANASVPVGNGKNGSAIVYALLDYRHPGESLIDAIRAKGYYVNVNPGDFTLYGSTGNIAFSTVGTNLGDLTSATLQTNLLQRRY
jgi:hypothetical protein